MPAESKSSLNPVPQRETEVFAVYGVEPEVLAYAMAKYSRSSLSMKESLKEISGQKAEKFLNTFYFQYGHRSIADLAHVAMAIERLSLLAAIALEDEQRWDGQERSTRYQDFSRPDYFTPDFGSDEQAARLYHEAMEFLFSEYRFFSEEMFQWLVHRTPRPGDMKEEAYNRTLRARAFDIARYLLPLATNTSVGQIVNARTLENQISRLLSHTHSEVRELGNKLKDAARSAAYDVHASGTQEQHEVRVAPTLVKYADPNPYFLNTRQELTRAAQEILGAEPIEPAPEVDLLDDEPVEIEIASTLLYEHCKHPYRQVRRKVESLNDAQRREIIDLGAKHRGGHDELLRAFCAGQKFRFDILMDIGGFRDLHRHRRCVQIHQAFADPGFDTPADVIAAGLQTRYENTVRTAAEFAGRLQSYLEKTGIPSQQARYTTDYMIPLARRKRTLFKMDFAEVVYISELRTAPAGHFSYRNIAYKMFEAVAQRHPALAGYFRVHDVRQPVDLLNR